MSLQCPECGGRVVKCGSTRGVQRYICAKSRSDKARTGKASCWEGTAALGREEDSRTGIDAKRSKALHSKISKAKGVQRYVITAAQNATPVNKPFFESLLCYCKANNAQLVVIPYRYKNPTSIHADKDQDWWAPELVPFLMAERTQVHKHVVILADIMTQPTATTPLSGFETMAGAHSAIIGHPKLELVTVPTPQSRLPKILTTTGAVTVKNYTPTKAGKKGDFHHTFGACVLEIDGGTFHMRQINAVHDGSFMDLNKEYTPTGRWNFATRALRSSWATFTKSSPTRPSSKRPSARAAFSTCCSPHISCGTTCTTSIAATITTNTRCSRTTRSTTAARTTSSVRSTRPSPRSTGYRATTSPTCSCRAITPTRSRDGSRKQTRRPTRRTAYFGRALSR
jgi:hypothetical protein